MRADTEVSHAAGGTQVIGQTSHLVSEQEELGDASQAMAKGHVARRATT